LSANLSQAACKSVLLCSYVHAPDLHMSGLVFGWPSCNSNQETLLTQMIRHAFDSCYQAYMHLTEVFCSLLAVCSWNVLKYNAWVL